jgi:hypothetical protein
LAGFAIKEAEKIFGAPRLGVQGSKAFLHLRPLAAEDAQAAYLKMFKKLV